jgi:acetyl-CoA carboxylase carboxyltransferase component
MTSLPEQYLDSMRQSQEAVRTAIDSWTKSVQQMFGQTPSISAGSVDADQIIDQVFDFAEQMLKMQRQFAKTLVASSPATPRDQAGSQGS